MGESFIPRRASRDHDILCLDRLVSAIHPDFSGVNTPPPPFLALLGERSSFSPTFFFDSSMSGQSTGGFHADFPSVGVDAKTNIFNADARSAKSLRKYVILSAPCAMKYEREPRYGCRTYISSYAYGDQKCQSFCKCNTHRVGSRN